MQLTDWLVVIFIVAIVVVLIDGVRRKLAERRHRVVMKLDRNIPQDIDPEELPNSELPNGGARTLERAGSPPPSLRTLQARKRFAFKSTRTHEEAGARAVPVLLDTVDIEEERIEHTNVFGDPHAVAGFQPDAFASTDLEEVSTARIVTRQVSAEDEQHEELIDGLDEEYEEDTMLAPEVARKEPGYMDTRYMGRRDEDDEDEYEDEEEFEDEEEEDEEEDEEDFEEFDDDLEDPDELDDEEEDEDEEDDDYDDEEDDDEDDDYDDEEDEEEEEDEDDYDDEDDDEEEDEDDLDELEGLPEDEWGAEEEQDRLVDDYENEPMPLQEAFDKAASKLDKVASQAATQLDRVASQAAVQLDKAATQFDKVASHAATQFDKAASHAASQFDRAAAQAASHLKRAPRDDGRRIEPGFGAARGEDDGADTFDEPLFTEELSTDWAEPDFDAAPELSPRQAERMSAPAAKRDQGELFGAAPARKDSHDARDKRGGREVREESRLRAALQKAVPTRKQAAPEPAPAAPTPQEVIVINVMARSGQMLHGGDLLRVLQGQGMRLGDMSIFHRHADSQGVGPVMFSMANMVKPGTFDLATMEDFATPGVSFFLQMPNKHGNMASFDRMLATASAVRDAFDAELKDEQRSTFTRQTVEHCRQRVRDFELKLLSRK